MPRDSSGNYTLPAGNPVVTGSTISSSWANTTLNDVASEITDSLDRSGKGGMLSPFKILDGTVGAPGLSFASEPASGLYRIGASQVGISIGGQLIQSFLSTGVTISSGGILTLGSINPLGWFAGSGAIQLNSSGIWSFDNGAGNIQTEILTNGYQSSLGSYKRSATAAAMRLSVSAAGGFQFQYAVSAAAGSAIAFLNSVAIDQNGAVVIPTPAAGVALSIGGFANSNTVNISGSGTSGQSFGVVISAGTTTADRALLVQNVFGTLAALQVRGDGVVFGNDGTSAFELGYKDLPQNNIAVNYTTVLADRCKQIRTATSNITVTIAANASVAYGIGTILNFVNRSATNMSIAINTDTLILGATATTGTRTLAPNGWAAAIKDAATTWLISGIGLS